MEHAWNETQEEDLTINEENVAMGMAQINYKRSLAPTFSNMTIQLIDQCEKQNRLVNSMKSGTKLLAIWERGLFACFVAQYRWVWILASFLIYFPGALKLIYGLLGSSRIKYIILWHISVKKCQLGMEWQHHWKESFIKALKNPQPTQFYVTLLYIQLENSPLKKVILWGKFQLVR